MLIIEIALGVALGMLIYRRPAEVFGGLLCLIVLIAGAIAAYIYRDSIAQFLISTVVVCVLCAVAVGMAVGYNRFAPPGVKKWMGGPVFLKQRKSKSTAVRKIP